MGLPARGRPRLSWRSWRVSFPDEALASAWHRLAGAERHRFSRGEGRDHAALSHQQHMEHDQGAEGQWQQQDVPHEYLAEVQHVEPGAYPGGVEAVLAFGGDPLGGEVLLRQVAGERRADGGHKRDRAGDPGQLALAAPCRHPERAPQVDDHEEEEQLGAPQVQAVDKQPDLGGVPPGRALQPKPRPRDQDHDEGRDREDAEHVGPRSHVDGLTVRQELLRREGPDGSSPHALGPRRLAGLGVHGRRLPGNGRAMAKMKTTTISAITTRFATEIRNHPQWMVWAAWLRFTNAPTSAAPLPAATPLAIVPPPWQVSNTIIPA